jgi:hypothetical protein
MRNKLKNLNVSEFFYEVYLQPMVVGESAVVDRLRNVTPSKRGRGLTRVLDTVTEAEWNAAYQLAATVRANMKGSERGKPLRAAVCAKAMAAKMEKLGVDNQVEYTCRASKPRTKKVEAVADITPDTVDVEVTESVVTESVVTESVVTEMEAVVEAEIVTETVAEVTESTLEHPLFDEGVTAEDMDFLRSLAEAKAA